MMWRLEQQVSRRLCNTAQPDGTQRRQTTPNGMLSHRAQVISPRSVHSSVCSCASDVNWWVACLLRSKVSLRSNPQHFNTAVGRGLAWHQYERGNAQCWLFIAFRGGCRDASCFSSVALVFAWDNPVEVLHVGTNAEQTEGAAEICCRF